MRFQARRDPWLALAEGSGNAIALVVPSFLIGALIASLAAAVIEPPLPWLEPVYRLVHQADSVPYYLAHAADRTATVLKCWHEGLPRLYSLRCTNALTATRLAHDANLQSPFERAIRQFWSAH